MNESHSREFRCPACGQDALLLREPLYEGFTRVGEKLSCALCGHQFEDEESVPYETSSAPKVFSEADRPEAVTVFAEGEADQLCRYCVNYVLNPFMQWCGFHKKEVQATDTCNQFARKAEAEDEKEEEEESNDPV